MLTEDENIVDVEPYRAVGGERRGELSTWSTSAQPAD